ncbi:hypothetical protein CHU_0424 [Cytophaga hutchinsonii ATCC 33406]|uniref:Uncharacterized protein n=1 Tax=Cytophaga hutchinsonii (strain ATCC 33406 / DSM 1761 / CIP 103989 / NBRC 15051 / NCIMB 9469 / D465) TaxID=269798 RepID=A0A6N4SN64_CYTH3|nr:hypothetical protein CHU_0424 [Cytophaga hutchinsonii ATCC 33406]
MCVISNNPAGFYYRILRLYCNIITLSSYYSKQKQLVKSWLLIKWNNFFLSKFYMRCYFLFSNSTNNALLRYLVMT